MKKNVKWSKITRDLWGQGTKSLLVMLALLIGILSFSMVANAYVILTRELDKNYKSTTPSHVTFTVANWRDEHLDPFKSLEGVETVEQRKVVKGRVQVQENKYKAIHLFVIDDFNNIQLDTFTLEDGAPSTGSNGILIERAAVNLTNSSLGDSLTVEVPNGQPTELKFTGTVHAPGLAPAWMEGYVYGFITNETFARLGGDDTSTQIRIRMQDTHLSKDELTSIAYGFKETLVSKGIHIKQIYVPQPNQHPHQGQMLLLLYLMEIFGLLAIVLSSILIANMISAILENQKKQIGIMKAMGASTFDIASYYL